MKTLKKRSQTQEKSVAKDFDARPTAASGALWGLKGDVRNGKFLIECKTTEKTFYSITTEVWEKIEKEAISDHMRTPLLVIDLQDKDRFVVYNPQYFDKVVDTVKIIETNNKVVSKSFKMSQEIGSLISDVPFQFSIKKSEYGVHSLCVWGIEHFTDFYKEELFEEE